MTNKIRYGVVCCGIILDDKGRTARPRQRSDDNDMDENGRINACDDSHNDSVTAAARLERRNDMATRSRCSGAAVSQHRETVARLYQPPCSLSPTSSKTHDNRRAKALSSSGVVMAPAVDDLRHRAGDVGCPSSMSMSSSDSSTDLLPGRFTSIEILERIFPLQRRHVLNAVLAGCSDDVVQAIEQLLSAQDVFNVHQRQCTSSQQQQHVRHHQLQQQMENFAVGGHGRSPMQSGSGVGERGLPVGAAAGRDRFRGSSTSALSPMYAAFSAPSPLRGLPLHSDFSPRASAFTTDTLLGPSRPTAAALPAPSRLCTPQSSLKLDSWLQSGFPCPAAMIPFLFQYQPHQLQVQREISFLSTKLFTEVIMIIMMIFIIIDR